MRPSLPFVVPFTLLLCLSSLCSSIHGDLVRGFRPPAIPLINLSPNVAAWMRGTNLTDQTPTMWYDHANSTMTGYLRVDGTAYRFLGLDSVSSPFASTLKGQRGYRPGKDLPNSPVRLLGGQASDCALLCDATRDCRAWSWFPSDCGRGNASMCFLKAELQDAVSDSCAVSDVQAVYLPDASINGEPKRDRGGSDISDFSMPSGSQPHDCAMQCFLTIGCDAWAFAHDNCPDYGPEPHCWIKSAGTQSAPYPTDCRTSGTGPYSAGWVPPAPPATATLQQMDLVVTPTRTIAVFSGGGVALLLTFMQPSFPHDIATSAREHVYIDAQVISVDGGSHDVQLYIDVASDFVVNAGADHVVWSDVSAAVQKTLPNAHVLTMSPFNTVPFNVRGDENRANWGDAYFATDSVYYSGSTQAVAATARQAFVTGAPLPPSDTEQPRASDDRMVVSAFTFDLGTVGKTFVVATVVLYYDEVWPMYFFRQLMPSYSSHIYGSWSAYLVAALQDFGSLMEQAVLYDGVLIGSLGPVVGDRFSTLLALIHRQVMGSTLIVWDEQRQTPWVFLKEMSTGGAISTIDVVYPAAPFYVALAPEALRLMLLPMLAYSNNETNSHYNLPWAPHHLGAWPVCDILSSQQVSAQHTAHTASAAVWTSGPGAASWLHNTGADVGLVTVRCRNKCPSKSRATSSSCWRPLRSVSSARSTTSRRTGPCWRRGRSTSTSASRTPASSCAPTTSKGPALTTPTWR